MIANTERAALIARKMEILEIRHRGVDAAQEAALLAEDRAIDGKFTAMRVANRQKMTPNRAQDPGTKRAGRMTALYAVANAAFAYLYADANDEVLADALEAAVKHLARIDKAWRP